MFSIVRYNTVPSAYLPVDTLGSNFLEPLMTPATAISIFKCCQKYVQSAHTQQLAREFQNFEREIAIISATVSDAVYNSQEPQDKCQIWTK